MRNTVLALTLAVALLALISSVGFVVYTAWLHDLRRGVFALLFAVMSARIALNWFLWREEEDGNPYGTSDPPF